MLFLSPQPAGTAKPGRARQFFTFICCNDFIFGESNEKEETRPMSTPAPAAIGTSTWTIDPVHSNAEFRVRHLMISNVRGQFTGVSGTLTFDESDPARSHVSASIDVATIDTRDPQRDTHLKSADFFNVEQFPTLTFQSSHVTRKAHGNLVVSGPITIHGVTKEVEFVVEGPTPPVKDPWGNTRIGVQASTKINRADFGLTFNAPLETGGVMVGEEVSITLELEFVKG
jgi:polyisoprenoid-binding protein YceI